MQLGAHESPTTLTAHSAPSRSCCQLESDKLLGRVGQWDPFWTPQESRVQKHLGQQAQGADGPKG